VNTLSWTITKLDSPKKFDSLMAGDFAQLRFSGADAPRVIEDLWVKLIGLTNKRNEYWGDLDDKPELIVDMPIDYQPIFKPCHVVDYITYNCEGMTLIDLWGRRWGDCKRLDESNYPIQCAFGQIQDRGGFGALGAGCFRGNQALRNESNDTFYFKRGHEFAGARVKGDIYKSNSEPQSKFDRAYKAVCKKSSEILLVHYAIEATLRDKVAALGISVYEYFPTLRVAQEEIWSVIKGNGLASNG